MLIVSRKVHQGVIIGLPDGRKVRVVLVGTDRGKCKIGVDAPSDVRVDREEVHRLRAAETENTEGRIVPAGDQ